MKSVRTSRLMRAVVMTVVTTALASSAYAADDWKKTHPRRAEVNARLANQNRRIHEERKEGDLTHTQAQALHADDRAIRAQERADAAQNGGHITKAEQQGLNQELNGVSQQIPR